MRHLHQRTVLLFVPLLVACGGGSGLPPAEPPAQLPQPVLISRANGLGQIGTSGDAESPAISGDGMVVACRDESGTAVVGDTNERSDILVRHIASGISQHVSRGLDGVPANGSAGSPALDQDGSHCAFSSRASNLVVGDSNDLWDIFVHDLGAGTTRRVSVASNGDQAIDGDSGRPVVSADGQIVVFESDASNLAANDTNDFRDIFVHDCTTGVTTRVSVDSAGVQATGGRSSDPHISADGRYVTFESEATNLVFGDTNDAVDVFLHDRVTGTTTRLSVDSTGAEGNASSSDPRISGDGAVVAFQSVATNLVGNDANGHVDIFVHVIATGATARVSVDSSGAEADDHCRDADIDAAGRYICFQASATNLVVGDTNGEQDVFRHDRATGTTVRVNTHADGAEATRGSGRDPAISDDGQAVAFEQEDGGLTPDGLGAGDSNLFHKDIASGALTLASRSMRRDISDGNSGGSDRAADISRGGRWIVFSSRASNLVAGDTNNRSDLFRNDTVTDATTRVFEQPVDPGNEPSNFEDLTVSEDGRFICFSSSHRSLVVGDTNDVRDVFVCDTLDGTIERVSVHTDGSQANARCSSPRMTPDARYVVFSSSAETLVDGDANSNGEIFLRDRRAGTTVRVTVDKDGLPSTGTSFRPDISDDGRFIVFASSDENLVPGDTNTVVDIFVRDMQSGTTTRVSVDTLGNEAVGGHSFSARLTGDGRYVAFSSDATNLVADDTNGFSDVFRRDLLTNTIIRVSLNGQDMESIIGESVEPCISDDGNTVLFVSEATDLVETPLILGVGRFARDIAAGTTWLVEAHPDGGPPISFSESSSVALTADGAQMIYVYRTLEIDNVYRMRVADGFE